MSLREALEAALVENPDDLAAHMAYADHLHDQGDPRGDLIQVQLALENPSLAKPDRARLTARETELLARTRTACLGEQLAVRLGARSTRIQIQRGWLTEVRKPGFLDRPLVTALTTAPEARLLRRLAFADLPDRDADAGQHVLELLGRNTNLRNLRTLHFCTLDGFVNEQSHGIEYDSREELFVAGERVWNWVANLPRLEELHLQCRTLNTARLFGLASLGYLRILQVNLSDDYPTERLATNPALANLTHLGFLPVAPDDGSAYLHLGHLAVLATSPNLLRLSHLRFQKSDAGDEGVRLLLASGMLQRLSVLDLAMGTITDEGASLLAAADLGDLEVLDVSGNAISPAGQRALGRALKRKLTLRMTDQHQPGDDEWLSWGETE